MSIRKKWAAAWLAAMTLTGVAMAGEYTGTVGTIWVFPTYSYDEFSLTGDVEVCSQSESGWRHKVRYYKADPGYETISKMLLAAKLSGKPLKVSGSNVNGRCILNHVMFVE